MSAKVKSAIITAAFVALLIVLMLLVSGYRYVPPTPPPPEEGVEVSLGDSDFGRGDSPEPASQSASYAPPAAQQQVATQNSQPTIPVPSSPNPGNITNPAAEQQPVVENKEPEINRNALFPGKRNTNSGGSKGENQGQGNQGNPNGTPSSNNYTGNGGNGGSYSLKDRSAVSLPKPDYNSNQQGKVVVRIWVNRRGEVTRVEAPYQGSTTSNGRLVEQAKSAAKRARFNASTDSPEEQIGTITYIFQI